ncbi:hypothetical protein BH11ARM1_BH11ARM1_08800 [soil metagenome]
MTFAWEGFSLEHPEDWTPITLSGTRREGYARIASSGRISIQIRWKLSASDTDLSEKLAGYLTKLSRDSKKKGPMQSKVEETENGLDYTYSGASSGRGSIFYDRRTARVFFLEVTSTKDDRLAGLFKETVNSFETGKERWALMGLDMILPGIATVEKKAFLAGKTELRLTARRAAIDAQRWGFGEQLVAKHGLEGWSRSAMQMPNAAAVVTDMGVALIEDGGLMRPPTFALVKREPEANRLVTVKVASRDAKWRPDWTWLA